jgi:hypothetical protein
MEGIPRREDLRELRQVKRFKRLRNPESGILIFQVV